jgi:hypothetical protein
MLSKNNTENIYIVHDVYQMLFTVKPHFIAPDSSPNSHIAMKLSSPVYFPCQEPRYNAELAYHHLPRCQKLTFTDIVSKAKLCFISKFIIKIKI